MTIRREDIDAGWIDLSDIAGPERVPLAHPGTAFRQRVRADPDTVSLPFILLTSADERENVADALDVLGSVPRDPTLSGRRAEM